MKKALLMALGVVLIASLIGVASSFNNWNNPLGVNGSEIVKSMTFKGDSLGAATATLAVFTPQRQIKVLTMNVYATTAFAGVTTDDTADATVVLASTANTYTARMDSGGTYQVTDLTDVTFPAVACTLKTVDGGGDGTGGVKPVVTIWYTDN